MNGDNVLSFPERTNRVTFSLHLFDVREANMGNLEVRESIMSINGSDKVNEEYVENELKKDKLTTEELKEKIHEAAEKPVGTDTALEKRMNRIFDKVKIKRKAVVDGQEEGLNDLLDENSDLKEELSKEPRIVMVLDNYSAHFSHLVRRVAKFLNIKLVFLPTHSPKLNPIEQVWRAMKKKISSIDFKCLTGLSNKLKFYYYNYVKDKSFTEEWIKKFISKS